MKDHPKCSSFEETAREIENTYKIQVYSSNSDES